MKRNINSIFTIAAKASTPIAEQKAVAHTMSRRSPVLPIQAGSKSTMSSRSTPQPAQAGSKSIASRCVTRIFPSQTSSVAIGGMLAAGLLLSGCVHTSPDPEQVTTPPAAWQDSGDFQTVAKEDTPVQWWSAFNDPVLTKLIEEAERNNLDLRLVAERVLEAHALSSQATAGLFPELTGSAGVQRSRGLNTPTRNNFGVGAEVTWEIDISGRLSALARAAEAGIAVTQADAQAVRLALLAEVASTYMEYRLQFLLLAIARESVRLQEETQSITEFRYEGGMASELEVQRGLSTLMTTRSEIASATAAAEAARLTLAYLLAKEPSQLDLPPLEPLGIPRADAEAVLLSPLDVLESRPDIRAARARYARAAADSDAATAARLPRLTLAGLIGLENEKLSDLFNGREVVWSAAGNLAAPLLDFGRRRSAADAADSRRRQAQIDYERTVLNALRETQTAIIAYVQGLVRHRELTAAMQASTTAVRVALAQYEEGVISQLEVNDAEKDLHQTRSRWAVSAAGVAKSLIDLYRVMGIAPEQSQTQQSQEAAASAE